MERRWHEAAFGSSQNPIERAHASEACFLLRSHDPVDRLVGDGVLSQKETQLGRMFLHVTQIIELQLQEAERLPL